MLLWFEQEGSTGQSLVSKYDLVQAVRINKLSGSNPDPAESLESIPVPVQAAACVGPALNPITPGNIVAIDPVHSTPSSWDAPAFYLNSEFSHIPSPACGADGDCFKNVRLVFTGPVRAASGADPSVFITKLDGDTSQNYALSMAVRIQKLDDAGLSDEIVISGNGSTLLMEGMYEITRLTVQAGVSIAPLADSFSPEDAQPVEEFHYRFILGSDCNLNGVLDYSEIDADSNLDVDPQDGLLDSCHPELWRVCEPDVNQDGNADQGDVDYLINIIAGGDNYTGADPDFNRDGNADQGDIDALINKIAGGRCP